MEQNLPPGEQPTPPPESIYSSDPSPEPPSAGVPPEPAVSNIPPPPVTPPPPPLPPPPPPPPLTPPPPLLFAAPPPPPRRGGTGWKIVAMILLVLVVVLLITNFKTATGKLTKGRSVHHKRVYLEEVVVQDNSAGNKIAVVGVEGVITSADMNSRGDNMVDFIRQQLRTAEADRSVKAVVLKVNSPGGEVLASDEIYNAIVDFQKTSKKPVVASMHTLAASGGYYVSAPCRWIVANEMTITGSIGVIMQGLNYRGLMDKIGVAPQTYKSGKFKDMLSGSRRPEDVPEEEREMIQSLIDETYGQFTNIVARGRGESQKANSNSDDPGAPLVEDWADYADGRVFSGKQAYELGFVDELGNFETAIERAKTLARITEANIIEYQQPFDLGSLFRIFGQAQETKVKVDIGVEFPKLQPGCLYFMYRQALP